MTSLFPKRCRHFICLDSSEEDQEDKKKNDYNDALLGWPRFLFSFDTVPRLLSDNL